MPEHQTRLFAAHPFDLGRADFRKIVQCLSYLDPAREVGKRHGDWKEAHRGIAAHHALGDLGIDGEEQAVAAAA